MNVGQFVHLHVYILHNTFNAKYRFLFSPKSIISHHTDQRRSSL